MCLSFVNPSVCSTFSTSFAACTGWVDIELGTVTHRNPVTDEETAAVGPLALPTAHFTPGVCEDSLIAACYFVYHSTGGAITKVVVDLTFSNVTAALAPAATMVRQEFSIEFVPAALSTTNAAENGNAVLRSRSGNPGYITGLPLLNAELVTSGTKDAMNARVPGLLVYGGASSPYCDNSMPLEIVNFGEDMVSGCVLQLTFADFAEMCSQAGARRCTRNPCLFVKYSAPMASTRIPCPCVS